MTVSLHIPPKILVTRRDPNSDKVVETSNETVEHYDTEDQALDRAIEVLSLKEHAPFDTLRIERIPDGHVLYDYNAIVAKQNANADPDA